MAKAPPPKTKFATNQQVVPEDGTITGIEESRLRTPDPDRVCPAYYNVYDKKHGHHLKDADRDFEMAVWSWGEQARDVYTEECYGDDSIGPDTNNKR